MSDVDPNAVPAICRGGKAARLSSPAGRHVIKQHRDGSYGSDGEFAAVRYGYNGGFVGAFRVDDATVKRWAQRAGPDRIETDAVRELWPDNIGTPMEVKIT